MPRHVHDIALREFLHHLHVAHQPRAGEIAFEEIVAQHGILGDAPFDRRFESIDMVDALAGEGAFAEQVLIDVGYCKHIRIETGTAGVYLLVKRAPAAIGK